MLGRACQKWPNLIRYLCRNFYPLLATILPSCNIWYVCCLMWLRNEALFSRGSGWGFYLGWRDRLNSTNSSTWRNSAFQISPLPPSLSPSHSLHAPATALPMWLQLATRQNLLYMCGRGEGVCDSDVKGGGGRGGACDPDVEGGRVDCLLRP